MRFFSLSDPSPGHGSAHMRGCRIVKGVRVPTWWVDEVPTWWVDTRAITWNRLSGCVRHATGERSAGFGHANTADAMSVGRYERTMMNSTPLTIVTPLAML